MMRIEGFYADAFLKKDKPGFIGTSTQEGPARGKREQGLLMPPGRITHSSSVLSARNIGF